MLRCYNPTKLNKSVVYSGSSQLQRKCVQVNGGDIKNM